MHSCMCLCISNFTVSEQKQYTFIKLRNDETKVGSVERLDVWFDIGYPACGVWGGDSEVISSCFEPPTISCTDWNLISHILHMF
jgi:hypothetical protein